MKKKLYSKPKIILIGGTYRAFITFQNLIKRKDIYYCYFICMKGNSSYESKYVAKIKKICKKNKIPFECSNIITKKIEKKIQSIKPDIMLGIGIWRSIIDEKILNNLKLGYLGVHGSPLPKYRGWAPINWQIINGEKYVFLRSFKFNRYIDAGPLLVDSKGKYIEEKININNEKHLDEILIEYDFKHIKLNNKILDLLINKKIFFKKQNNKLATYGCNRNADDSKINWNDSTKNVFNFIRAHNLPSIGSYTYYDNKKVYIWKVRPKIEFKNYIGRIPGKIVHLNPESIIILTKDSALEILNASFENITKLNTIFNSVRKKCI